MSIARLNDSEVRQIIEAEERRLREEIVLIASENYPSAGVLAATGSVMTCKYAEGYPGRRYYAGCENMDEAENLAITRARELFAADHANVQPHSGTQANMAAYMGLLKPGDRVLGMRLDQGGHLSHGSPVNASGEFYEFASYGVDPSSELIDYDEVQRIAREFRPKLIIVGATAYSRVLDYARFRTIADDTGALLVADIAHIAGLIAGGAHPSPVPHADVVTSSTHKTLRGPRGGMILSTAAYARAVDRGVFPANQGGPQMHSITAKAVGFGEALQPEFGDYARMIIENSRTLAEALTDNGMRLVAGGTDNHLFLIDLKSYSMTGAEAQETLKAGGIVCNKNAIPFDPKPLGITSGIRLGTPAITTRGMKPQDMQTIAGFIVEALHMKGDTSGLKRLRTRVTEFASRFPVPGLDD